MCLCDIEQIDSVWIRGASILWILLCLIPHPSIWVKVQKRFVASVLVCLVCLWSHGHWFVCAYALIAPTSTGFGLYFMWLQSPLGAFLQWLFACFLLRFS